MKIAIDLNDVIRGFSKNFEKYYCKDRKLPENDDIVFHTNNMREMFDFSDDEEYQRFLYEDYPLEIFGLCPTVTKNLAADFNNWLINVVENLDIDDDIEFIIVSPMEYGVSIQSTFFFLSKIGCRLREVFLPKDSSKIWDKCDVLITANPKLLDNKPEDKKTVKIEMPYNKDNIADFTFESMADFISDENNIKELLK